jgi:peptidoglycan biosynthesis protein MviN/MurJ (putative lipid II flippase)
VVGYPTGYAFVAGNQNRRFLAGAATAAVLDVILDVSLIPVMGPLGAALAMSIALSAACLVWLGLHGLALGDGRWLLLLLFAVSMAAIPAEAAPASTAPIAAGTLCLGVALGVSGVRPLIRDAVLRRSPKGRAGDPS